MAQNTDNIKKFNRLVIEDGGSQYANLSYANLEPLVKFEDATCEKVFEECRNRLCDGWSNPIANVNSNNSLAPYNEFILNRLSYAECSFLASDSIINNAITKYSNELFRKGGHIVLKSGSLSEEAKSHIKSLINKRIQEIDLWSVLSLGVKTSLTFGGALIFIDVDSEDLSEPLYPKSRIMAMNKIRGLRVVPPYLCAASEVNTSNPLNKDYMKPSKWYVSGNKGLIDSSRVLELVMFEAPLIIKPLFNFMGISLCQFMKSYVASADIARQGISDMLLRFRSEIIKSDLIKINPTEAVSRAKAINKQKNNNALILLTKDEEYIQSITPLGGLDKLVAQLQENVAVSARMPSVKLLGLTPSGFNSTGDFDLQSYYDEMMSLQQTVIKPIVDRVLSLLFKEIRHNDDDDMSIEYEFNILEKSDDLMKAQMKNLEMDFVLKAVQGGIMMPEQAFGYLKSKGYIEDIEYKEDDPSFDFDYEGPTYTQEI